MLSDRRAYRVARGSRSDDFGSALLSLVSLYRGHHWRSGGRQVYVASGLSRPGCVRSQLRPVPCPCSAPIIRPVSCLLFGSRLKSRALADLRPLVARSPPFALRRTKRVASPRPELVVLSGHVHVLPRLYDPFRVCSLAPGSRVRALADLLWPLVARSPPFALAPPGATRTHRSRTRRAEPSPSSGAHTARCGGRLPRTARKTRSDPDRPPDR